MLRISLRSVQIMLKNEVNINSQNRLHDIHRPPYNTGNDFVYADDFTEDVEQYVKNSGQYDLWLLDCMF